MNAARYLVGFGAMVVALVPILIGSRALCCRFLPSFVGPAAWLATAVVALTIVIVASEVLGTVGLFALLPVVATFAAVGFLAWWIGFQGSPARDAVSDSPRSEPPARAEEDRTGPWGTFAAIAAVALVTAEWSIRTVDSFRFGMMGIDTLWYHLPIAARFAESGRTWDLHYIGSGSLTVFYPAESDLLHGLGIVFLGTDLLSPLLNTFWLALAFLAAWCVGRPYGFARLTLMGVAFLLATPVLALLQPGGGMNDVVGVASFLAAAAILVTATNDPRARLSAASIVCAALAAGLALGTKYTFIVPVVVLGIGVVAIGERGERLRRALLWFAAIGLAGGYWYLRNVIAVGNPVPPLRLDIGPVRVPSIPIEGTESVATYLFNREVWGDYFLPGLRDAFGPAWVVLMATSVAGIVLGFLLGRDRVIRMLAVVAGVSLGAYIFSPQRLGPLAGVPIWFSVNLRYASPALAIGVVVLPLALDRFGRRAAYLLLVLYGGALLVTQLDSGIWQRSERFSAPPTGDTRSFVISLAIGGLVAATAWLVLRSRLTLKTALSRPALGAVALLAVGIGCAGGYLLSNEYSARRYQNAIVLPEIFRWAKDIQHSRIAIVGTSLQYPLYGTDSSNFVQYIAVRGEDGTSTEVTDCATWRRVLNEGDYRYVMITSAGFPFPDAKIPGEQVWTDTDPAARLVMHNKFPRNQAWLYRIDGRLDPARCGEN